MAKFFAKLNLLGLRLFAEKTSPMAELTSPVPRRTRQWLTAALGRTRLQGRGLLASL